MKAAKEGNKEMVETLLSVGADKYRDNVCDIYDCYDE